LAAASIAERMELALWAYASPVKRGRRVTRVDLILVEN
jgi:hypothetical protein